MSVAFGELRRLFKNYGYSRYKMGKFEEYDFYAKNKQSLISQGVITFTDINGKLMALKPDVTLSIIKHLRDLDNITQKFFYDEKVYRVSKNHNAFKEITQVGIEAAGVVDDYVICEVLELAIKSLNLISNGRNFVLDISNLSVIKNLLPDDFSQSEILNLIAAKNIHGLKKIDGLNQNIIKLVELNSDFDDAIKNLKNIAELENFVRILEILSEYKNNIRVDFSTTNDPNYYNGIIFKGFVDGVPECVLSGGQYDYLIQSMGHKNSKAIGFALYVDLLENIDNPKNDYDADILITYDENTPVNKIRECVKKYRGQNLNIAVQKIIPENLKYKELVRLQNA